MLRRLHPDQPESFAFTPENRAWAEAQITKYPEGRQASAIIPLLWRAQEQEGWLSRAAIEHVAAMLDMAYIRALEVATFYFMFQLQPVGIVAHIQICGTTSCMICGAEDLVAVCKDKIAKHPHQLSEDGRFSWEEVECLGACSNAPMAQIGKDYYEDLTAESLSKLIDDLAAGKVPQPGPQNGRFASEPKGGLTSLESFRNAKVKVNASVRQALDLQDTVKRIDGTEVPLLTPWMGKPKGDRNPGTPAAPEGVIEAAEEVGPVTLSEAREGKPDDLTKIKGIGPKLESVLHSMGFFHYDQIATWTDEEVAWVDANIENFKGRASRDGWVDQARELMENGAKE
jgi:NADH-quinone oxidoreductase subunit E